jgi:hypothetical protein
MSRVNGRSVERRVEVLVHTCIERVAIPIDRLGSFDM